MSNSKFMDAMSDINSRAQKLGYTNGMEWANAAVQSGEITPADLTNYESAHRIRNMIAHGAAEEISVSAQRLQFVQEYILPIIQRSSPNPESPAAAQSFVKQVDPQQLEQWYKNAAEHYSKKEYEQAVAYYAKAAEGGHALGQLMLGYCHEKGQGIYKDFAEAARWYTKAADQGLDLAQWNLALLYERGDGVPRNCSKAQKLARQAAAQGNSQVQFKLGEAYWMGTQMVEQDNDEAMRWFHRAAQQGHAKAQEKIEEYFKLHPSARAAWYRQSSGGYEIKDNVLLGYYGDETSVVIPYGITAIGMKAFYQRTQLTSVTIPNTVTSIGFAAFADCKSLKKIKVPDSVTKLEKNVFSGCEQLNEVILPKNLTEIPSGIFFDCKRLRNIQLPAGVKAIPYGAFYGTDIQNLNLLKNITTIGDNAFDSCQGLKEIHIPGNVKTIGKFAFNSCRCAEHIFLEDGVTTIGACAFQDVGKAKYEQAKRDDRLHEFNYVKLVKIPSTVTEIGENAFKNCGGLQTLFVPKKCKLKKVGVSIFKIRRY